MGGKAQMPGAQVSLLRPGKEQTRHHPEQQKRYAVARCCSCPPNFTLITFDTPGSCMVTP